MKGVGVFPGGWVRPDSLDRPLTRLEEDARTAFLAFEKGHVCRPQGLLGRLLGRPRPERRCLLQIRPAKAAPTGYTAVVHCDCGAEQDITDPRV